MPPGETVAVTGVCTRRFDVEVRGWGRVVGLRFRPGGLAALTGPPASAWTDRSVAAAEVLPRRWSPTLADPGLAESGAEWAEVAERAWPRSADERPDPRYELLLEVVADMLADRTLLTVADVAQRHGLTVRTLQRLFTHYVGVGPKWVLARYRLHDAVADLDAGWPGTLTDLARALRLVRPGPLHPRLHRPGRGHPRPVPRPRVDGGSRARGILAALTSSARRTSDAAQQLLRANRAPACGVRRRAAAPRPGRRARRRPRWCRAPSGVLPSAISRIVLRRILPERVLGRAATMSTWRRLATAPTSSRTRCTSSLQIRIAVVPGAVDPALEHDEPAGHLALEVVGHADDRALGDVGVAGEGRLDRAGREPVARRR